MDDFINNNIPLPAAVKMKKCVIIMSSHWGHYNASIAFAGSLARLGYEVTYLGESRFKNFVNSQGFRFKEFNLIQSFFDHKKFTLKLFFNTIFLNFSQRWSGERSKRFKAEVFLFKAVMNSIAADMVFIDSFLYLHSILLRDLQTEIILLETMFSRREEKSIPPLNEKLFILNSGIKRDILVKCQWIKHYFQLNMASMIKNIAYLNLSYDVLVELYLRDQGVNMKEIIALNKCFFFNLKGLKEIVLSPKCLNFRWKADFIDQYHYNCARNIDRLETDVDTAFLSKLEFFKNYAKNSTGKIIYCSLGTISALHYKNADFFLKDIINAFNGLKDRILIVATGSQQLKEKLFIKSENIFIFCKVPQMEVLNFSNLMVTHGGLNSIIESIITTTPVLVFPLNNYWDHKGNAARVEYHGIGLTGNLAQKDKSWICKKTEQILNDNNFIDRIKQLKICFKGTDDDLMNLSAFINENLLSK